MKSIFRSLFPGKNFLPSLIVLCSLFVAGFFYAALFYFALLALTLWLLMIFWELYLLYGRSRGITAERDLPKLFSNGDLHTVSVRIQSHYDFPVEAEVVDELPVQFQIRDFLLQIALPTGGRHTWKYNLRPLTRGEYRFGLVMVAVSTGGRLIRRKFACAESCMVKVYPSFIAMQKFHYLAITDSRFRAGVKQIRRKGHSPEFENIRQYSEGDDHRLINWNATARRASLMVNQYRDLRDQPVYCVLDKGRQMKMPFGGMTLLDYAINATLVLAGTARAKDDKTGLCVYADRVEQFLPARTTNPGRIRLIMDMLYNQETRYPEPDFSKVTAQLIQRIRQRSLIIWFTNFETLSSLKRQLPFMQYLSKHHYVVTVLFKNTALYELTESRAENTEQIYMKTAARQFELEKLQISMKLQKAGLHPVLTEPEDLNMRVVNTYLAIKTRGVI